MATSALLTVAASLVPLMVIFTELGVPSTLVTVKVSLTESPTFRSSLALLAVKVQSPAASIEKSPMVPLTSDGVKALSGLSTSVLVKVPLVLNAASVSFMATSALLTVAASLTLVNVTDASTASPKTASGSSSLAATLNVGAASPPSWTKRMSPATTSARVNSVIAVPAAAMFSNWPPVTSLTWTVTALSTSSASLTARSVTVTVTV